MDTEKPLSLRSVQPLIGKRRLLDVLTGLNGGLIYETQEEDARCLKLGSHGAFLSASGEELVAALVGCLEFANS